MGEALRSAQIEVLGEVAEGDDQVHVLYRTKMKVEEVEMTKLAVVSFKRSPDGWRGLLLGDVEGMAAALRAAADRDRRAE